MVYIIILVYNGKKYLPDLISSLEKINYPDERHRIVFVDNGSEDGSSSFIESRIKEVETPRRSLSRAKPRGSGQAYKLINLKTNLGFAAGNNIGIKYALDLGAQYIVLLNQDTVTHPDFLEELLKVAEGDEKIGIVQSLLLYFQDKDKINSWGNKIHYLGFEFTGGNQQKLKAQNSKLKTININEIGYASGSAMLIKAKVLKEIGLFDEDLFLYHEDADLSLRARLKGFKIVLAPKSKVYHKYEFMRSIKKYYYMERNRIYTLLKFYKIPTLILILPAFGVMEMGLIFFSIIRGFFWQRLKAYRWILSHLFLIFKKRKKIQSTRKFGDKILAKYMTGKIEFQEIENPLLKFIGNPILNLYWQIIKRLIWW